MGGTKCDLCGNVIQRGERAWTTMTRDPDGLIVDEQATHQHCARNTQTRGQRIRVECDGTNFSRARVLLIQSDNTEIPISSIVTACVVRIEDQHFNTATITFEGVELDVRGTTTNPVYVSA